MNAHGLVAAAFGCACWCATAPAAVLYDGTPNTVPSAQGWIYLTNPFFGPAATQSASGGVTTLDTTLDAGAADRTEQAGYFSKFPPFTPHPGVGTLDRTIGFTLSFDLRVLVENHNVRDDNGDAINDRAGFSCIIVTEDLKAIEIAFWQNEVWAYNDDAMSASNLFTHAEGAAFDTTLAITRFNLTIFGAAYTLSTTGGPLLTGALRDYQNFAGSPDVYALPSFIFLGDDTTSAESKTQIQRIELNSLPEPGAIALLAISALLTAHRPRRD